MVSDDGVIGDVDIKGPESARAQRCVSASGSWVGARLRRRLLFVVCNSGLGRGKFGHDTASLACRWMLANSSHCVDGEEEEDDERLCVCVCVCAKTFGGNAGE